MATTTGVQHLLVDPTTSPIVPSFVPAPRLSSLTDKRIGLLDDAKENARELLEVVAELLKERYGVSDVSYHRKPSASKPAEPGVIEEMAADCDYVIVAIGS